MLPLSLRISVLAGIATVSGRLENWTGKLVGAVAPPRHAGLLHCLGAISGSDHAKLPPTRSLYSGNCGDIRNL